MSVHACESVGDNSRFLVIFFLRERERERERVFVHGVCQVCEHGFPWALNACGY